MSAGDLPAAEPFTERTPRVVAAMKLHRAARRRETGLFLCEGENSVAAALAQGVAEELFVTVAAAARFPAIVTGARGAGVTISTVTPRAAARLADSVTAPGLSAVCRTPLIGLEDLLAREPGWICVAVETADPGNAGVLLRLADAFGAGGVVFAGNTVDPLNAKVVRASAGSLFHVPVVREPDQAAVYGRLKQRGYTLLATAGGGQSTLDRLGPEVLGGKLAWLLGNEAHGLNPEALEQADVTVRIPMVGLAESLNVSSAASVCMYTTSLAQAADVGAGASGRGDAAPIP